MQTIWEDPDVRGVYAEDPAGEPQYCPPSEEDDLYPYAMAFFAFDGLVGTAGSPEVIVDALKAGVQFFEAIPDTQPCADGHRKFVLFITGHNVNILWELFQKVPESAIFADWMVSTIESRKWGADGRVSALGNMHSVMMGVATLAGGGIKHRNGDLVAPNGDDARLASGLPPREPLVSVPTALGATATSKRKWWKR